MNTQYQEAYPGASLEQSIDIAAHRLHTVKTIPERRSAWNLLQTLVRMRSKERVKQMEQEQGLAR